MKSIDTSQQIMGSYLIATGRYLETLFRRLNVSTLSSRRLSGGVGSVFSGTVGSASNHKTLVRGIE